MENNNQNNFNNNNNNTQQNSGPYSYYQNLYNMFGGYNPIIDSKVKELRNFSLMGGCTVLGFVVMQYAFVMILQLTGLFDAYKSDTLTQIGLNALSPLLYILIPFTVLYLIYKPAEKEKVMVFEKPKSAQLFVLAIFAGLMVCFAGDTVTNYISAIFSNLGVTFSNADSKIPSNALGYFLFVLECAVMPALLEEFAFRGVLMQPLRKYGDKFAILATAFIFAIMHGNMIQIPFAFIAGIALGYFAISTGSIWTSVTIHFLNNLTSVIISIYYTNHPNASQLPYFVFSAAIFVIGVVALVVFIKTPHQNLNKNQTGIDKNLLISTYICTPPVVLAIIFAIYSTLVFTEVKSAFGGFLLVAIIVAIAAIIIHLISLMRKDKRINQSSMYTATKVIVIIAAALGTYIIIVSALSGNFVNRGLYS